ncbi:hypothetical protein K6Y31_10660 [Motilimonas cestriensis]|uniref:Uncharacterized protein n=1 Tax=Motilimonas cestriensis TaxID=2742685 RepID=A0ABS8W8E6_9GAMM|nr:hypothetical protein [Motilimonas cestriensis]MCE2595276.1 hypothetical protein [Motilimonas cestriensis]
MRLIRLLLVFITLCSCLFNLAQAANGSALMPSWQQWVQQRHPDLDCPWLMSVNRQRVCNWPAQFKAELTGKGMRFEMTIEVFSRVGEVRLPGNQSHWPSQVTVDQQPAVVIDKKGKPYIQLKQGRHLIKGQYFWSRLPSGVELPDDLALISVVENGQKVPTSIINNQLIFAQKPAVTENAKDTLRVEVYRMLTDDVPMRLTTQIKLFVSGKPREVEIGQVSWDNINTLQLASSLPARLEENGMLRVQVKPGIHDITLHSRVVGNITAFQTNKQSTVWPDNEYVSFTSDPRWREVSLTGATSVDTSLVDIPSQWKNLPTYRLQPNQTLQITSKDSMVNLQHNNTINISREIWLAFNGQSAVVKDLVRGEMNQGWRLNADSEMQAGRALVNGQAVLITDLDGQQGVEVRSPQINLEAVSSIKDVHHFNAVGWQSDVTDFRASIHLPPGWRALHASGVDGVEGTWIQQWNLWDIFWLMILIAVANKLLGVKGAILMALTLILSFHEDKAPNAWWAILLLLIGLISLPIGKYKVWVSRVALIPVFILALSVIVFSVSSLRLALYPSLEHSGTGSYSTSALLEHESVGVAHFDEIEPLQELQQKSASPMAVEQQAISREVDKLQRHEQQTSNDGVKVRSLYQVGENDRVQTGPGVPTWRWNRFDIQATGMVTAAQKIDVIYSSPWMTALWRVLNVLLLSAMALVVVTKLVNVARFKSLADEHVNKPNDMTKPTSSMASVALVIVLGLSGGLISQPSQAQEFPPEYLLTEYEARLLAAPDCLPHCVSLDQGHLQISDGQLRLSFTVIASERVAIALPTAGNTWQAETITLDNQEAVLRKYQGRQLIYVAKGQHQVSLQGPIINDEMAISLPLAIHNFTTYTPDWLVDGIRDGVVLKNNIGLVSKQAMAVENNDTLAPLPVKSYAIVHRQISLGNQWQVETHVEKISPLGESATFTVALLPGEQVLSSGHRVNDDGSVTIQIPKGQRNYVWHSALPITPSISLQAAKSSAYSERWRVIPSSIWHVSFSGIAAVKPDGAAAQLQPQWKPWAGEQLDIQVQRPAGIAGSVFTTEKATLSQVAGKNSQTVTLKLNVRASQGIDYQIDLANDANITALMHDGQGLSINSASSVVVPLHPGEQDIELKFQLPRALTWAETSAEIQLPGKVSNIDIEFELPRDRWLLFLNGPSLGASMLYWGMLCVVVLGGLALPLLARKLRLTLPVNTMAWILVGLGFSTVSSYGVVIFALFFFAMAYRNQFITPNKLAHWQFNMLQVGLLLLTLICLISLLLVIPVGLLATPDMQVVGNGSSSYLFNFFQDHVTSGALPSVQVYSLPLWVYRVMMLLWSLWIATQLIKWGKWWFVSYTQGGAWLATAPMLSAIVNQENSTIPSDKSEK